MINAIHINSTAPFKIKKKESQYFVEDFELLSTILSALMWRKNNGTIKLYTDKTGYDCYSSLNILDLWDGGIDSQVVENIPETVNQEIFWAAAKLFALQNETTPVAMIDTDLVIWEDLKPKLASAQFAVLHREEINPASYLPAHLLKKRNDYQFDPEWDWTELPCNMAFAYFSNPDFKKQYTHCAIDFMTGNSEYPMEMVSQMVFAEQRIVAMCAKKMNIPIVHFLEDPFQPQNSCFTHIWGGKDIARNDSRQRKVLCIALLRKIEKLFPKYYSKLKDLEVFSKYL